MTPELRLLPRHHEGRDLRADGVKLRLPFAARLWIWYLDRDGNEREQQCSYSWARHLLKEAGYTLHDGRERWRG